MMHVTLRFAKNELYIQFQNINVGLFGDYSKSIYQCRAFISMASLFAILQDKLVLLLISLITEFWCL